jgi:hypothetical protein
MDGIIPEGLLPPKNKLMEDARKELEDWVKRLEENDVITFERESLKIPLEPRQIDYKRNQLGDFSEMNKKWSTQRSETTHTRLLENPEDWYYYHSLYREARKEWDEIPYEIIAEKISKRPDWIVGDFGCGENLLSSLISNRVHSFDHVAIDNSVIACDIKNVPLDDSSLDVVVLSLALMGSNSIEYLSEASRVLRPYGKIFICEPFNKMDGREESFITEISNVGLSGYVSRRTEKFIYIDCEKIA